MISVQAVVFESTYVLLGCRIRVQNFVALAFPFLLAHCMGLRRASLCRLQALLNILEAQVWARKSVSSMLLHGGFSRLWVPLGLPQWGVKLLVGRI